MESDKQSKPKRRNKLFKFLPTAASAVSFQNPPFSPGRDHKKRTSETKNGRTTRFSGPLMVSIIPTEARMRRQGMQNAETPGLGDPTSPKVSCMGQIKKKRIKKKVAKRPPTTEKKGIMRFFCAVSGREKKSNFDVELTGGGDGGFQLPERAPALGQMRRFASSRDAFANFDWSSQIAPVDTDKRSNQSDEVRIPFSAPMAMGGGGSGGYSGREATLQPKKEISIWKRRTMAPPRPLQLEP